VNLKIKVETIDLINNSANESTVESTIIAPKPKKLITNSII